MDKWKDTEVEKMKVSDFNSITVGQTGLIFEGFC